MKRIINTLQKNASKLFILTMLACTVTSCDSILNFDEGDCSVEYRVRFKYDYNMKKANAFASEVKTVTVYAFDDEGKFVYQRTEEGEILKAEDYSMKMDVDPGNYHLVAWAGLTDDKSFAIPLLTPGSSDIDELTVKARRIEAAVRSNGQNENIIKSSLSPLFHGEITKTLTRAGTTNIITIPLVKNTNSVRIILQQMDGVTMGKDDFDFSIYDDNGWMNYDNSLLKDEMLTYKPFNVQAGTTGTRADGSQDTDISVVAVDLSVARLMADKNPTLRITKKETNEVVLQIPLVQYMLLARPFEASEMEPQEYLDRQDQYAMTFFLDSDLRWITTQIIINGWTIRENNGEL